jgi:general stress protein CsbA
MLVMYFWVIGIDVGHVFLGNRYRCWLCISGLLVSILVMYFWVIGIDVGHVFVGYRYRCCSCICVL